MISEDEEAGETSLGYKSTLPRDGTGTGWEALPAFSGRSDGSLIDRASIREILHASSTHKSLKMP